MSLRVFLNMSSKAPLAARRLFSSAGITRGPGGRASAGPSTVTVFGSTGQLGRYVVTELAKRGNTVVVPYRGDDMEWRHLKVAGDLGRVIPVPYSVRDMTSVKDALQYSDKAINLIGKFWETQHVFGPFTPNYTLYDVNVTAAETIAKACNDMGTDHLVHVSALAANEESGSEWARTKAYGEKSVRRIKGDATIVRLGQLFGQEDNWLNLFAYLCRTRVPGVGPFVVNGGSNKVQPLWAPDAGEAIAAAALLDETAKGLTYHVAGCEVFTQKEVLDFVIDCIQTEAPVKDISSMRAEIMGGIYEQMPDAVKMTRDTIRLMQEEVVCDARYGEKTIADLGVEPRKMSREAFNFLIRFRQGGHFIEL